MTETNSNADVLALRTTNLNIRISPLLKSKLIDVSMQMGINMTDYIYHILTKAMSGENKVENTPQYLLLQDDNSTLKAEKQALGQRYQSLEKQYKTLEDDSKMVKSELAKYERIAAPHKANVGKPITVKGKTYTPQHPSEIIHLILQNFQIAN